MSRSGPADAEVGAARLAGAPPAGDRHRAPVNVDLDEVARAWWEGRRLAAGSRDERKRWSLGEPPEVMNGCRTAGEIVDGGGERAVELIVGLLSTAPDDSGPSSVGAGPLEDLVTRHGNDLSAKLDDLARRSAAIRRALAFVWIDRGLLNPHAADRLARWIPGLAGQP